MNRYRLIEVFVKIFLWIAVILIYIMHLAGIFEALPDRLETLIISLDLSAAVILLWFMPSAMAERKLKKGLKYLEKDSDKAVRCFEEYLDSKMHTEIERKNALRILGIAHHKRGDDKNAIHCLNQALEGQEKDNDLKVEILGAMGIIFSEAGEYQKAVEHFDRAFEIIFSMSRAYIDKNVLVQVMYTYIKAGQKEKAAAIYDRLLMIRGFKRDRRLEKLLNT